MLGIRLLLLLGAVLLAGCGVQAAPSASNDFGCVAGQTMTAKGTGGAITFLRSPVVYDDLSVVQILQQYGPIPGKYGDALVRGVDAGTVRSYHGENTPGFVFWHFHGDVELPARLPFVNSLGICRGNTKVVKSDDYPGWQWVQVPHWARLNVPTHLLLAGPVCARAQGFKTIHTPRPTEGSFVGVEDMICGLPGRMQEIVAQGYQGVHFFFITGGLDE